MKTLVGRMIVPLLFVGLLAAGGCGGSSSNPTAPNNNNNGGGNNQVTISGDAFSALTVPVGTTVTWKNNDAVTHTATSDVGSAFAFDTGNIAAGATSVGVTFTMAGVFHYHCTIHSFMHGTITVQ